MKKIVAMLALVTAFSFCSAASASEYTYMDDLTEDAKSLTITYRYEDAPVAGAEFTVYHVAGVEVENGRTVYSYTEQFADRTEDLSELTTEASIQMAAQIDTAGKQMAATAVTDEDGRAVFPNLEAGLYLVTNPQNTGAAAAYETLEPYLVAVPLAVLNADGSAGTWLDVVESVPKTEVKKTPEIPVTGDSSPILWLAVIGGANLLFLAVVGLTAARRRAKEVQ